MKTIIGFTFGVLVTLIGATYLMPGQTIYETEIVTRTVTEEVTVYTDLDELREAFAKTAEQLRQECLYIIERQTGDPMPGIIAHIDRHYQGDACRAADEVLNGGW